MTYITRLQRAGVSPRETMELARHSDMRLTMKTYTDAAALSFSRGRSIRVTIGHRFEADQGRQNR